MGYIVKQANVWHLSGDLHMDNANAILNESVRLHMDGLLEIDFAAVEGVDTSALALMLEWLRRAKVEFCQLSFTNVPENLKSLVTLYGVEATLRV